jgi:hypothetical protein
MGRSVSQTLSPEKRSDHKNTKWRINHRMEEFKREGAKDAKNEITLSLPFAVFAPSRLSLLCGRRPGSDFVVQTALFFNSVVGPNELSYR